MRLLALVFTVAGTLAAAIDGTVINGTTGKPQAGASVLLTSMGQGGMLPLGTARTGTDGKFRIEGSAEGAVLLQVTHAGITYSQMLMPGAPTSGIETKVYDTSSKPGSAEVLEHVVLLQPGAGQVAVNETVIFRNSGKVTYNDPVNGTLRLYVPGETKDELRVMARAPQGMPVPRAAVKTKQPNVYKVDFPIKPGETSIDLAYTVPLSTPPVFAGKVLHPGGALRLVVPQGVTLSGAAVARVGEEPQSKAQIYAAQGPEYKVQIQGSGELRAADTSQGAQEEEDSGPPITQILPSAYDKLYWTLGLAGAILALGFVMLYLRGSPREAPQKGKNK
ncbi:MAG: carboxypeptidase-like regulatory domain-containing protein [Bryobacteraceae bacterium]